MTGHTEFTVLTVTKMKMPSPHYTLPQLIWVTSEMGLGGEAEWASTSWQGPNNILAITHQYWILLTAILNAEYLGKFGPFPLNEKWAGRDNSKMLILVA